MIQIYCVQHQFGLTLNVILSQLIPGALQIAFEEDREFRQGLPLNYLDFMGVANSELVSCYPCTQNQYYHYPRKLLYCPQYFLPMISILTIICFFFFINTSSEQLLYLSIIKITVKISSWSRMDLSSSKRLFLVPTILLREGF